MRFTCLAVAVTRRRFRFTSIERKICCACADRSPSLRPVFEQDGRHHIAVGIFGNTWAGFGTDAPNGTVIQGVQCQGTHCDNKRFLVSGI